MLKTAFSVALKRYWGAATMILLINAASEWRHDHQISATGMLVTLLVVLALFFFVAVPVEFHKLGKSP
jgi:hypothetical protein